MIRNSNAGRSAQLRNAGLAIALMIPPLYPGAALAAGQDCMASYYRSKQPSCVDGTLAQLRQEAAGGQAEPNTIIGFLAGIFRTSPEERERLLKAEPSNYVQPVDTASLYRAGRSDEAQKFAAANNRARLADRLRAARIPPLDALR